MKTKKISSEKVQISADLGLNHKKKTKNKETEKR